MGKYKRRGGIVSPFYDKQKPEQNKKEDKKNIPRRQKEWSKTKKKNVW